MDLGYSFGGAQKYTKGLVNQERRCLECNKVVSKDVGNYLYFQRFCSENCKEKYINSTVEPKRFY